MCIPGFVFRCSKNFRRNWRLKYTIWRYHAHEGCPLRYVCGQTIHPTAMVCTFLESPTDPDVHPRKRFALFGQSRRNWRRRSRHLNQRNSLMLPGQTRLESCWWQFFFLFVFNILVCNALFFNSRAQISKNLAKLTYKSAKCRVSLLCLNPGWVHCVTFAATPTMVHAFSESPSNLDVHPGICFWIFEKMSSKLASKSTLHGYIYVMLTKGSIALRLRANY